MKRGFVLIVWLVLITQPLSATAHSLGRQQLERVPVGDYLVTAWTDPVDVQTDDELHVTVAIEDNGGLVLDMDVAVIATLNDEQVRAAATHENAVNKLHYEAPMRLEQEGMWQVTIALQAGEASFELEVKPAERSIPWKWIGGGVIGLLVAGLIVMNRRNEEKA